MSVGAVIEKLGARKGEFVEMLPVGDAHEARPSSCRSAVFSAIATSFMTDTKGEGIMSSVFERYEPYKGELTRPRHGLASWPGSRARL